MLNNLDRNYHSWFRTAGAPLIILRKHRLALTLSRALPILIWLSLSAVLHVVAWYLLIEIAAGNISAQQGEYIDIPDDVFLVMSLITTLCLPLALLVVPWWVSKRSKVLPVWLRSLLGALMLPAAALALSPAVSHAIGFQTPLLLRNGWEIVIALVGVLLAIYLGIDTLLYWVLKQTVREFSTLTTMTVKVLPVLMIAVLFFFVNGDIWRVADALEFSRVWQVVAVLGTLGALVSISTVYDRTKKLLGARTGDAVEVFVPADYAAATEEAGGHWGKTYRAVSAPVLDASPGIRRGEWYNLTLLPVLVQTIQALLFGVLVFAFFVWFGDIAIPGSTVTSWLTHESTQLTIAGLEFPYSTVLVKVSMVLGAFAALNFMAQTATDPAYSQEFLEPVLLHVRQVVMIRNIYLAQETDLVPKHDFVGEEEHEQGDTGVQHPPCLGVSEDRTQESGTGRQEGKPNN